MGVLMMRDANVGGSMAVFALVFLAVAPTLSWLEFSSGSENLNVATALEIRRTGQWGLPTLNGEPRVAKPPLTAWVTAAAVTPATVRDMSAADASIRAAAERRLAWQTRWPFWLSACLTLVGVYLLGRILADGRLGLVAMAIAASNLMFLRFGRAATTDVQLMLWVTLANVCFAAMLFNGRRWVGAIGAAVAVGLAFISKGPVALVQTIAPVVVYILWQWIQARRQPALEQAKRDWRGAIAPALIGTVLFVSIALPWYAWVLANHPEVWQRWQMEVTREGATDLPAGRWYNYLSLILLMVPWVVYFIVGLIVIVRDVLARRPDDRTRRLVFALVLLLVPIVIMSFFRDRKQRYLLPMLAPAAIVAGRAVIEHFETRHTRNRADRTVLTAHWVTLGVMAMGLPIVGATPLLRTIEGQSWYGIRLAAGAAIAGGGLVMAGILLHRRHNASMVTTTLVAMLLLQAMLVHGYRNAREGRSEMKPLAEAIWESYPDAQAWFLPQGKACPPDLPIYLNRPIHRASDQPTTAPAALTPATATASRPQVLVVRQGSRDPEPQLPPPWAHFQRVQRDNTWWHAFVSPPVSAQR